MTKLKLSVLADDKPVKVSVELSAVVHRTLIAYADIFSRTTGRGVSDPAKLIAPMIEPFMATDRAFLKARRSASQLEIGPPERSG